MPGDVEKLKDDPAALKKRVKDHITDEISAMKGKLVEWDVLNEPYSNHDLMDILGEDVVVEWFKQTHDIDPTVKLYINDYGNIEGNNREQMEHYEKFIANLIRKGAPLHGIGLQSHFGAKLVVPEKLLEFLDRFSKFELPLEVTEFDITIHKYILNREEVYADYMRDFMTVLFSYPSVHSIMLWGFWEGAHWVPDAALFRKDWSMKPSGKMWKYLVLEKWRTNVSGKTDNKGEFTVRGFHGKYDISVKAKGKTKSLKTTLTKGGQKVTAKMD
jgi:GH35 family endo-1,4-beta-xylanase